MARQRCGNASNSQFRRKAGWNWNQAQPPAPSSGPWAVALPAPPSVNRNVHVACSVLGLRRDQARWRLQPILYPISSPLQFPMLSAVGVAGPWVADLFHRRKVFTAPASRPAMMRRACKPPSGLAKKRGLGLGRSLDVRGRLIWKEVSPNGVTHNSCVLQQSIAKRDKGAKIECRTAGEHAQRTAQTN